MRAWYFTFSTLPIPFCLYHSNEIAPFLLFIVYLCYIVASSQSYSPILNFFCSAIVALSLSNNQYIFNTYTHEKTHTHTNTHTHTQRAQTDQNHSAQVQCKILCIVACVRTIQLIVYACSSFSNSFFFLQSRRCFIYKYIFIHIYSCKNTVNSSSKKKQTNKQINV